MHKKLRVSEVFNIFTETNTGTLRLTPKDGYKYKMQDQKLLSGEVEIDHVERDGVLYLGISKYATCTSVKNCWVSFEHKM